MNKSIDTVINGKTMILQLVGNCVDSFLFNCWVDVHVNVDLHLWYGIYRFHIHISKVFPPLLLLSLPNPQTFPIPLGGVCTTDTLCKLLIDIIEVCICLIFFLCSGRHWFLAHALHHIYTVQFNQVYHSRRSALTPICLNDGGALLEHLCIFLFMNLRRGT